MEAVSIHSEPILLTRLETKSTKEIYGLLWSEYTRKVNLQDAIQKTGKLKFFVIALPLFLFKYVLKSIF